MYKRYKYILSEIIFALQDVDQMNTFPIAYHVALRNVGTKKFPFVHRNVVLPTIATANEDSSEMKMENV